MLSSANSALIAKRSRGPNCVNCGTRARRELRTSATVALAGISMTSFVAQQLASHCDRLPAEARPDAVMLISHSGNLERVTFGGELAALLGVGRALSAAGWTREDRASHPLAEVPRPPTSRAERLIEVHARRRD